MHKYNFGYKNFPAGWHPEGTGPPNASLGTPDISETTKAKKV